MVTVSHRSQVFSNGHLRNLLVLCTDRMTLRLGALLAGLGLASGSSVGSCTLTVHPDQAGHRHSPLLMGCHSDSGEHHPNSSFAALAVLPGVTTGQL